MKQSELFIRLQSLSAQLRKNNVGSYLVNPRYVRSATGDDANTSLFSVIKRFGKATDADPFLMLG